jgi:phage shock protein PspC (stress-responsive transcriptional regulator)
MEADLKDLFHFACAIVPIALSFVFAFWARDRGLQRTKSRWLAGVCGGIAKRFQIAPWLVRLLCLFFIGISWMPYIIMWGVVPEEKSES